MPSIGLSGEICGGHRQCRLGQSLSVIGELPPVIVAGQDSYTVLSNVHDPRALATILERAENELSSRKHPDPYICTAELVPLFLAGLMGFALQLPSFLAVLNGKQTLRRTVLSGVLITSIVQGTQYARKYR
jgi:hypothetical protein